MHNIHIHLFQLLFCLPPKWKPYAEVTLPGGQWITIDQNRLGLVRLQLGNENTIQATIAWFKEELAMVEGSNNDLALLVWVAEKVGLPTCNPALQEIRATEVYRQVTENGLF